MTKSLRSLVLIGVAASFGACASGSRAVAPPMSPDEMTKKATELATPSAGHQRLEAMVGRFDAVGQFWMEPDAPPVTSAGVSNNEWVLGGRYLRTDYSADFMGSPFNGIGLLGFNNATHTYESTWMDTMSTAIMPIGVGTADASGKAITLRRAFPDPVTGEVSQMREVFVIQDRDHHVLDSWATGADGKENHMMRIVYTRAK